MFNKLLPKENKKKHKDKTDEKSYTPGENIFFKEYRNRKKIWKVGVIDKCIGKLIYIIKDSKKTIKRNRNQIWKRYLEDTNNKKEEPMKVIDDLFNVPMPSAAPEEKHSSKLKRIFSESIEIPPPNTTSRGMSQFRKGGCWRVTGNPPTPPHRIDWSKDYLQWCLL